MMTSSAATTRERRAVASALDEVYAAWAAGDADAFVAPYSEHATAVLPGSYGQASPAPKTRSVDTWLLFRQDGSWRVQAFHSCPEAGG